MCGICGLYSPDGVDAGLLQRMNDTLVHRGPDDQGTYIGARVGLGSRRLSIVDLATGHMPISNEDRTVWVIQNGEIYNFHELRRELLAKGHHFETQSDTEAIVHLYEEEGEAMFKRLRGMFGLAVWDERRQVLLLGRDHFGKKPLYYSWDGRRLLFGSEIKALRQDPELRLHLDLEALNDYFSYLYIPEPRTIFREVRKLPAAHYLKLAQGRIDVVSYWDVSYEKPSAETDERFYLERLRELLVDSVRTRLMSDVPLGAFLSGGVDSATVVGIMSQIVSEPVKTFSIGFDEESFDELRFARLAAQTFKTNHHEEIVKPQAADLVEKLVYYYDEPFGDPSALPTYLVSQMARRHVTVVLTGDGGDEPFAGYASQAIHVRDEKFHRRVPVPVRQALAAALDAAARLNGHAKLARIAGAVRRANAPLPERFCNVVSKMQRQQLLAPDVRQELGPMREEALYERLFAAQRFPDFLSRILYADTKVYLVSDILAKVDRASMAHSLEARTPLVDYMLYDFVATIPSSLKLHDGVSKYIFKKAVEAWVPPEIVYRKKHGFAVPINAWFRKDLRDMLQDHLRDRTDAGAAFFDAGLVDRLLEEHTHGKRDWSIQLWTLLVFRLWYRHWAP